MSRVDELIKELCPNGVVFEEIGAVVEIKNGKDWKTERPGKIPVFGSGGQMDVYVQEASCAGPSVLLPRKGSLAVQFVDAPFWNVDTVFYTKCNPEQLDIKYFYYVMERVDLSRISTSSTRPSITQTALKKLVIPVPPLEIQLEIARILDKFTQLEAELEAELEARRKQYVYYREQLLTAGDSDTKSVMLKDISDMKAGKSIPAAEISDEYSESTPVPCFGGGGMRGYVAESNQTGGKVLIGRQGALCGNVAWASDDFYATEHTVVVSAQSELDPRWAFHKFIAMNLNQYASKSAQPGLAVKKLKTLEIDLPPLVRQREVAAILDKFDALVNDISTGLPAEIAARRKQYEYYRDKLLSFEPV